MVSIILTIFYKAYVPGVPKCEINHACSSAHSSFPSTPLKFGGKGSEVCTYTSSFLSEARSQSDRLSGIIRHAFALILELSVRQAMPCMRSLSQGPPEAKSGVAKSHFPNQLKHCEILQECKFQTCRDRAGWIQKGQVSCNWYKLNRLNNSIFCSNGSPSYCNTKIDATQHGFLNQSYLTMMQN